MSSCHEASCGLPNPWIPLTTQEIPVAFSNLGQHGYSQMPFSASWSCVPHVFLTGPVAWSSPNVHFRDLYLQVYCLSYRFRPFLSFSASIYGIHNIIYLLCGLINNKFSDQCMLFYRSRASVKDDSVYPIVKSVQVRLLWCRRIFPGHTPLSLFSRHFIHCSPWPLCSFVSGPLPHTTCCLQCNFWCVTPTLPGGEGLCVTAWPHSSLPFV